MTFTLYPGWRDAIEEAAQPALEEKAAEASDNARGLSPRRTGDYAASHRAAGAAYGSDDPAAHLIEFGYGGTPAYRPLTRGAETAGLRFEPIGGTLS